MTLFQTFVGVACIMSLVQATPVPIHNVSSRTGTNMVNTDNANPIPSISASIHSSPNDATTPVTPSASGTLYPRSDGKQRPRSLDSDSNAGTEVGHQLLSTSSYHPAQGSGSQDVPTIPSSSASGSNGGGGGGGEGGRTEQGHHQIMLSPNQASSSGGADNRPRRRQRLGNANRRPRSSLAVASGSRQTDLGPSRLARNSRRVGGSSNRRQKLPPRYLPWPSAYGSMYEGRYAIGDAADWPMSLWMKGPAWGREEPSDFISNPHEVVDMQSFPGTYIEALDLLHQGHPAINYVLRTDLDILFNGVWHEVPEAYNENLPDNYLGYGNGATPDPASNYRDFRRALASPLAKKYARHIWENNGLINPLFFPGTAAELISLTQSGFPMSILSVTVSGDKITSFHLRMVPQKLR